MNIGNILEVPDRLEWRKWLRKNHKKEKEIWLVYYKKGSGKKRIPYNDSVEEALCYGWIDSTQKTIDADRVAQRFTPRKKNSKLSQMNKERISRLIKKKKMTKAGIAAIEHLLDKEKDFKIPSDILKTLKKDESVWENFNKFPESYKRIRIAFIEGGLKHGKTEYKRRLNYFIKMTSLNKRFGMVQ
jgi:uncharacterized protein YdeI (YjbR/CyaY-like superfamily)